MSFQENDNSVLFDEVYQLKALVAQLQERVHYLEDLKQEERIGKLEQVLADRVDNSAPLLSNREVVDTVVMPSSEQQVVVFEKSASTNECEENRIVASSFPEEFTTSMLSTLLTSPLTSISAMGAQLPPLSSTSIISAPVVTSLKAFSFFRNSVSTISSSVLSSIAAEIARQTRQS